MKMYTLDGQAVELVKKIEDGYLAKVIFEEYPDEEGDEETEYGEFLDDRTSFFETLFEKPMTEAFAKEVKELKAEAVALANEISDLKDQKRSESGLLNKIAKFPFIQKLVDYMTDDYEFILVLTNFEVYKKSSYYCSKFVKAANLENGGWGLWKVKSPYYISDPDDVPFMPFRTMDELNAFTKERLINHVQFYKYEWNKSENLKQWYGKLARSCEVKTDPEFMEIYNGRMDVFLKEEAVERADKLKKEVLELEKKKQELEKLTA